MNKKLIGVVLLLLVAVGGFVGIRGFYQGKVLKMVESMDETHLGGAVLKEPARERFDNIYSKSEIVSIEGYGKFDRQVRVYGLTLIAHESVSDDFLIKISNTMMSMFPKVEGDDAITQENVLQNLYQYKGMLPVVSSEKDMNDDAIANKLRNEYSLCDIIMKTENNQVNEVVEHLLHVITDVGLHYEMPHEWGIFSGSNVEKQMQKSITNKDYLVDSYKSYPESIKTRVLVQEYAYWAISSNWNLQEAYGVGDEEWKLNNSTLLNEKQPEMVELIKRTVDKIMIAPEKAILNKF